MAFPKVVTILGFLVAIFLKQIKYGHMEPPNFSRILRFFLAILVNELNGAMWHPQKWQKF
jgi:hypothetical protein